MEETRQTEKPYKRSIKFNVWKEIKRKGIQEGHKRNHEKGKGFQRKERQRRQNHKDQGVERKRSLEETVK